jgi:hypothetical protein
MAHRILFWVILLSWFGSTGEAAVRIQAAGEEDASRGIKDYRIETVPGGHNVLARDETGRTIASGSIRTLANGHHVISVLYNSRVARFELGEEGYLSFVVGRAQAVARLDWTTRTWTTSANYAEVIGPYKDWGEMAGRMLHAPHIEAPLRQAGEVCSSRQPGAAASSPTCSNGFTCDQIPTCSGRAVGLKHYACWEARFRASDCCSNGCCWGCCSFTDCDSLCAPGWGDWLCWVLLWGMPCASH